ncbi:tetratricopeptide repeat protein [Undibacterium sp. TC9W]|uniref:tetratricopeptide repeat protein n=1 Tax=Undibacterium sp. TC9W TaxID=3413053 RepID=UPI003BF377AC
MRKTKILSKVSTDKENSIKLQFPFLQNIKENIDHGNMGRVGMLQKEIKMNRNKVVRLLSPVLLMTVFATAQAQSGGCVMTYSPRMGVEALDECAATVLATDTQQLTALGDIFLNRRSSRSDLQRAISYYTLAAQAGDAIAQVKLGRVLKEENASPEIWLPWIEKSVMTGNRDALEMLTSHGWLNVNNEDPNDRANKQFYLQTIIRLMAQRNFDDQSYCDLAIRIGYMHYHGIGTTENPRETIVWYERAGKRGAYKPRWSVIKMYQIGDGVPSNPRKAEQLLKLFLEDQKSFFVDHPAEYVNWLTAAANIGISSAAFRLANIYEKGTYGVTANSATAKRWRRQGQKIDE